MIFRVATMHCNVAFNEVYIYIYNILYIICIYYVNNNTTIYDTLIIYIVINIQYVYITY